MCWGWGRGSSLFMSTFSCTAFGSPRLRTARCLKRVVGRGRHYVTRRHNRRARPSAQHVPSYRPCVFGTYTKVYLCHGCPWPGAYHHGRRGPPRSSRGRASLTPNVRPPSIVPCSPAIAGLRSSLASRQSQSRASGPSPDPGGYERGPQSSRPRTTGATPSPSWCTQDSRHKSAWITPFWVVYEGSAAL